MVEALCIVLSIFSWWHFHDPIRYIVYYPLLVVPLVIISVVDLRHLIIPDAISIPGIVVGFGVHVILESGGFYFRAAVDSAIGAVVGGLVLFLVAFVYEKLKEQEGLGGGDIKFIAMLGAFFGWKGVLLVLLMSSITGSIIGLILILFLRKNMKYAMPYGPFLALAGLFVLYWGREFLLWYTSLFI